MLRHEANKGCFYLHFEMLTELGYLFIYFLVGLLPACFAHSFVAELGQIVDLFGVQLSNSAIQE